MNSPTRRGSSKKSFKSEYDNSKGFGAQLAQSEAATGGAKIIGSRKASTRFGMEENDDAQDEGGPQTDWDEIEDAKLENQKINFPQSKSTGTVLVLERMDYMAKQVERLTLAHKGAHASSKRDAKRDTFALGNDVAGEAEAEDAWQAAEQSFVEGVGRRDMEDLFVKCCQSSDNDLRLFELLGAGKEDQLYKDQQKIVEYFRHKSGVLDRTHGFAKQQDMFGTDDDALGELSANGSKPSSPKQEAPSQSSPTEASSSATERSPLKKLPTVKFEGPSQSSPTEASSSASGRRVSGAVAPQDTSELPTGPGRPGRRPSHFSAEAPRNSENGSSTRLGTSEEKESSPVSSSLSSPTSGRLALARKSMRRPDADPGALARQLTENLTQEAPSATPKKKAGPKGKAGSKKKQADTLPPVAVSIKPP